MTRPRPQGYIPTVQRGRKPVETEPGFHKVTGEPLPPCKSCGRTLRPHRTTIEEYPKTVPRVNFKLCSSCGHQTGYLMKRQLRAIVNLQKDTAPDLVVVVQEPALEHYLQRRRMRLLQDSLSVRAGNRSRYDKFTR